ncbi:hypothetical protein MKX01_031165, partial [Papaver californicum]
MVEAATAAKADLEEVRKANDESLTPSNYHSFKLYLKQRLISQYLWGIVDGSDCRTTMLVHTEGTLFAQGAWSRISRAVGDCSEVKDSYAKYLPLIEVIRKDDHRGFWSYYGHFHQEARADRLKEDGATALFKPKIPFAKQPIKLLDTSLFFIPFQFLKRFPRSATTQDENGKTVFSVLAGKPSAFPSGNQFGFFQRRIYGFAGANRTRLAGKALKAIGTSFHKQLHEKREKHDQALQIINFIFPRLSGLNSDQLKHAQAFEAIYQTTIHGGIIEFFTLLTNSNHNLINFKDEDENGLFQHAVFSRQEKILCLLVEMGLQNQSNTIYDKHKNNILHCAGSWKPSSQLDKVSGAALQMQREIQWFQ